MQLKTKIASIETSSIPQKQQLPHQKSIEHPSVNTFSNNVQEEITIQSLNKLINNRNSIDETNLPFQAKLNENESAQKGLNMNQVQQKPQKQSNSTNLLKSNLKQSAMNWEKFRQKKQQKNISKIRKILISPFRSQQFECRICERVIRKAEVAKICSSEHIFCKTCITNFVIYKIKTYQEVFCPEEGCNLIMSQATEFYQNLSQELKKKYVKVHNFYLTSKDSNLKLCPKENCEGIIRIEENQPKICQICKSEFCPKCYYNIHQGDCNKALTAFLEDKFLYKQCQKCKIIVERTKGCNHMTCKCGYQFCYRCGQKWKSQHKCNQNPVNRNELNSNPNQRQQNIVLQPSNNCCSWRFILLFPVKVLSSLIIVINMSLVLLFALVGLLLAGIFGYSIVYICKLFDSSRVCLAVLMIIFPPIAIVVGIGTALQNPTLNQLVFLTLHLYSELWGC